MSAPGFGTPGNNLGITTRPIDFDALGSPQVKTYHGVAIVFNGQNIGRLQSWQPQMYTREGSHVYELNSFTFGRPVDYVPGVNTNYTISASRVEVWNQEIELALGYPAVWQDLIDQDKAFTLQEYLYRGQTVYRSWSYQGCWFADRNENAFEAQGGDTKIMANVTINFITRQRGI